jgi:hypothetical protein
MSGLDVNGQVKHMQNILVYPPHDDYTYARTNDGVELINSREIHHRQQQQQVEGSYPSPASTISPHGTPHSRDPTVPISTSSDLAFALESKPTDQTPGSRAYGDHRHQNQLSAAAAASATSHADAHGVVDRTAEKADFYNQQQQHETQSTDNRVYQQETDRTGLNSHSHYIATSYSSLCDAYPGSTDHQMDYTQCVRSGVSYSPSAYGETILGRASSLNGVIQPVEPFTSYST